MYLPALLPAWHGMSMAAACGSHHFMPPAVAGPWLAAAAWLLFYVHMRIYTCMLVFQHVLDM
jgi:hypothetical protein